MNTKLLSDFRKDENGGILAFYVVMFITMMIGGGMAIDFMRHEIEREAIQDALDRGVLAAAANAKASGATSADEITAAETAAVATVRSYIETAGFDPDTHGVTVTPDITPFSQRVDADADFNVDTFFLSLTGIDSLGGAAAAGAAVSVNQIEISLVVDISGSMEGTKMDNLHTAATTFVTDMLSGDKPDYTTISLVPFSGQTSATPEMMTTYNYNSWHNYSNCVDFSASDYTSASLSTTASLSQTQHFAPEWIANQNSDWCPRSDISILPFSNDKTELTNAIADLRATGMTAGQIGMKWGVTLLDESSQPLVTNLIAQNLVDPVFAGRPAAADDEDTLKFVIMMTDGNNTSQYNVKENRYKTYEVILDSSKGIGVSPNYNAPMYVIQANGDDWGDWEEATGQRNADYWNAQDPNNNYVPWSFSHLYQRVSPTQEDTRLQNICTAAKNEGIVIFTIGYDISVNSNAYTQMRSCATTVGHFYNVETTDLSEAFSSIQQAIEKLKLVN